MPAPAEHRALWLQSLPPAEVSCALKKERKKGGRGDSITQTRKERAIRNLPISCLLGAHLPAGLRPNLGNIPSPAGGERRQGEELEE